MFIKDTYCISPQHTYDDSFFENDPEIHVGNRYTALEPPYGSLIPAGLLRRMGKSVRMGVGAALPLIERNPGLDGIILATANGGLADSLKFLNQIVEYQEGTLTPTNFVQSTPNALAGNLALMSKNTGYNTTHVNKGLAFEAALLDAFLLMEEKKAKFLLLGSVEEISDHNYNIDMLAGSYKKEETNSDTLFGSDTAGTVCGEAAVMFVAEAERSASSLAEIVNVEQISYADEAKLRKKLTDFLQRNHTTENEIDALILGLSGDNRTDHWYHWLHENIFPNSAIYHFKNLTGDFPTASAFATWLGVKLLNGMQLPQKTIFRQDSKNKVEKILVYNHHKGDQHGFILLSK